MIIKKSNKINKSLLELVLTGNMDVSTSSNCQTPKPVRKTLFIILPSKYECLNLCLCQWALLQLQVGVLYPVHPLSAPYLPPGS